MSLALPRLQMDAGVRARPAPRARRQPRGSECPPVLRQGGPGERGGAGRGFPGVTAVPDRLVTCREKWCHMTQEERDDSLRFNENITFGQLG